MFQIVKKMGSTPDSTPRFIQECVTAHLYFLKLKPWIDKEYRTINSARSWTDFINQKYNVIHNLFSSRSRTISWAFVDRNLLSEKKKIFTSFQTPTSLHLFVKSPGSSDLPHWPYFTDPDIVISLPHNKTVFNWLLHVHPGDSIAYIHPCIKNYTSL